MVTIQASLALYAYWARAPLRYAKHFEEDNSSINVKITVCFLWSQGTYLASGRNSYFLSAMIETIYHNIRSNVGTSLVFQWQQEFACNLGAFGFDP